MSLEFFNPFLPTFTFLYPLKQNKTLKFFIVFRGYSKVTMEINGGYIIVGEIYIEYV